MKKIMLLFLLGTPMLSGANSVIKVGLILPTMDHYVWRSKEIEVAAHLAIETLPKQESPDLQVVPLRSDLGDRREIDRIMTEIADRQIDAVIAGATARSADALRYDAPQWSTPTVLITSVFTSATEHEVDQNPYVVNLGMATQDLQQIALRKWQTCYAQDGAAFVFNEDFFETAELARTVQDELSDEFVDVLPWSDERKQREQVAKLKKVSSLRKAMAFAGAPWNAELWAREKTRGGSGDPIYIFPYASSLSEMPTLARLAGGTLYTATQYSTDPAEANQLKFSTGIINQLGWSHEVPMTPHGFRIYDALAIISAAADSVQLNKEQKGHWWQEPESLTGIKGALKHHGKATIAPPIDFIRIERNGGVVFAAGDARCPW